MPPDTVRAAVVQLLADEDTARNISRAGELVQAAVVSGAQVVVLPEKWNWWGPASRTRDGAEGLDGPALTAARTWARDLGVALVAGSILEAIGDGTRAHNTSLLIAPDGRDAMLGHARQLHAAGIPFVFDPGQGLPMFDGAELRDFIAQATWVAVNDYEARMLCDRTGLTLESLSDSHLSGVIVTLGAQGCDIWIKGRKEHVPGVQASAVLDPTGCGDAFRGALLFGLERGWSLQRCVALGNRLGAAKIACRGGQNHQVDAIWTATV